MVIGGGMVGGLVKKYGVRGEDRRNDRQDEGMRESSEVFLGGVGI